MSSRALGLLLLATLAVGCGESSDGSRAASSDSGPRADADAASTADGGAPLPDGGAKPDAEDSPSDSGACPEHLRFGANIHDGTDDPQAVADIMAARHLTTARMDLWGLDTVYVARFRTAVAALAARGLSAETVVYDSYSRGYPAAEDCGADPAAVEAKAYDEIRTSVQRVDDVVHDFELENEISLYPDIKKAGTTGQSADDYEVPCGLLQAANLRGMSRAIVDERTSTGLPLRIILGTTDRSFGLLSFMEQHGVTFDVVGYHIYPWEKHAPLDEDPWFGVGGPLGQLAQFNRPIHINEFNCGEIYDDAYENQAGQPLTETCFASITKHLQTIATQTVANVESLHFYELFDEPSKAPPENRFGLLYDPSTPKVHLYLAAAFSGGALTSAEAAEITSRGLLTNAQIDAWSPCGAGP